MFNWIGNLFPYSDLHSLNLDWILSKMKETAAQAAKAVADAANALAQVAEAKAAALSAQTAATNAQTAAQAAQSAAQNAETSVSAAVQTAQAAQETSNAAQEKANAAQTAASTAQETAQSALDKFPVQTADIANGAVLADKIGAYQITSGKIGTGAVLPEKLGPNEMRIKDSLIGYSSERSSLNITYDGVSLNVVIGNNFYNALLNNFDTTLARLNGSDVTYSENHNNRTYKQFYVRTPILFYTTMINADIHITCGLYAPAGDNVEFDVIIHNNGDGTGTATIDPGNSVILGDPFTCHIRLTPFACELHRAAK